VLNAGRRKESVAVFRVRPMPMAPCFHGNVVSPCCVRVHVLVYVSQPASIECSSKNKKEMCFVCDCGL
jgi:hypothetical protein